MRVTRKTVPDLLPRIALWSVVFVLMALISIFKERIGIERAEIASGVVLLLAVLAMLVMRPTAKRRLE